MVAVSPTPAVVDTRPPFRAIFLPFPIACFALTLATDLAYWQTTNLMWQNFSAWLLFAGLIFGFFAILATIVDLLTRRLIAAAAWPLAIGGIVVLVLAFLNSLVHAGDGWTAVVPYGLLLSAVTVIAMAVSYGAWCASAWRIYSTGDVHDVP